MKVQPPQPGETEWTVVAAGRSIATLDIESVKIGNVVAINNAYFRVAEHAGVWMAGEASHHWVKRYGYEKAKKLVRDHEPHLWCPRLFMEYWRTQFTYENGRPIWIEPFQLWPTDTRPYTGFRPPWHTDNFWCWGTTLMTLALICHRAPSRIRVVGADMDGKGGYLNEKAKDTGEWFKRRWDRERRAMAQAVNECEYHGIEVEVLSPEECAEMSREAVTA